MFEREYGDGFSPSGQPFCHAKCSRRRICRDGGVDGWCEAETVDVHRSG